MNEMYRLFPLSGCVRPGNVGNLVLSLVIHLAVCAVLGLLQMILGWIPIVGWMVCVVCSALGLYCVVGMGLSVVRFLQH